MLGAFVERLLRDLRDKQDVIKQLLVSNRVSNMEEYRLLNGKIQGLEECIAAVQTVMDNLVRTHQITGDYKE